MKRNGRLVFLYAVALSLLVILPQAGDFSSFKNTQDAGSYIRLAEGQPDGVLLHHARRMFHPWVVGNLRWIAGTDAAFIIVGILSLIVFLWIVLAYLHKDIALPLGAAFGFVFLPYLFILFHDLYLQTLFFLALSALFWLLILRKKYLAAVPLLFLMSLTRDEAVLIALVFLAVLLFRRPKDMSPRSAALFSAAVVAATGLGAFLTSFLTRANTNINRMSQMLFSALRLPLFLFENLTGLQHWLDTYKVLPDYTHPPMVAFDLPAWVQKFSAIRQFGFYEWNPVLPAWLVLLVLSAFGTGPTIVFCLWKRTKFRSLRGSLALSAMLLFGALVFVISPALGPPVLRYFANAWPLFFLVMPALLRPLWDVDRAGMTKILIIYFLSGWLGLLSVVRVWWVPALAVAAAIPLHILTWKQLTAVLAKAHSADKG